MRWFHSIRYHECGRHFLRDDHGGILVMFAAAAGVIFGFMALVWDIGRTVSTATELQSFADHLALAAAAELDGDIGAIAAAQAIVSSGNFDDLQTFGGGGAALDNSDVTLSFFASIPDDDTNTLTDVTNSDLDALYVAVDIDPRTVTSFLSRLLSPFLGTSVTDASLRARAVAGRKRLACATTPLVFCAPDGNAYQPVPGRMIHLKMTGAWQPGEFGVLANNFEPGSACGNTGTAGGAVVSCITGIVDNVTRCFDPTSVAIVNTVSRSQVAGGLNARFDIYLSQLTGRQNDARFAPAPSVAKAIAPVGGGSCIADLNNVDDLSLLPAATRSVPLPRDDCFDADGTCSVTGSRLGTGITAAALDDYWSVNHDSPRPAANNRFELYQEEVAAAPAVNRSLQKATSSETGAPICYRAGTDPTPEGPERRLVSAAVIDCGPNAGLPSSGLVFDVPVHDFVQLFLTEPAELSPGGGEVAIWAEEVAPLRPDSDGLGTGRIRDVIQLVR